MDVSNVPGYWDAEVKSPGEGAASEERDLQELVDRCYCSSEGWYSKFRSLEFRSSYGTQHTERLENLIYHSATCNTNEEVTGQSLSVGNEGKTTVETHFGFSLIATWRPGAPIDVHQSAGFLRPEGETDVTFKIGGNGLLDTSESL
jgi:hypothetical protein